MDFDAFIEQAWNDHGDAPRLVADRLADSLGRVEKPEHIAPFARLALHVYGVHLGETEPGARLLDSMRQLAAYDGSAAVEGMLVRSIATLRLVGGVADALAGLDDEARIAALATASNAFVERGNHRLGIDALNQALALAAAGLPTGSPALRALAVGGNNLAAALEEKPDRDAAETQAMVAAAESGLQYWKLAGTWFEEQRAEYRLASSLLKAQRAAEAASAARRCIALCEAHDAPPFERFFGHAVRALALHAANDGAGFAASRDHASTWLAQVGDDERAWCEADRAALDSATRARER